MKFPFKVNDQVRPAGSNVHIGTVTGIANERFSVRWKGQDMSAPYPISFAGKHIISIKSAFKDKNNPNIAFKKSKRRKLK